MSVDASSTITTSALTFEYICYISATQRERERKRERERERKRERERERERERDLYVKPFVTL